jgi:hypothetical protein
MTEQTLTEEHLDKALAAPMWNTTSCIVAQTFGGPEQVFACGRSICISGESESTRRQTYTWDDERVMKIMRLYDDGRAGKSEFPDWESRIRAMLPVTFKVRQL